MADTFTIYKKCERCEGDGTVESGGAGGGDMTCERCGGTGEIEWGRMEEDV